MNTFTKKRGRGRPPKSQSSQNSDDTSTKKRGRKKNIVKQQNQIIDTVKNNCKQSIIVQLKITQEDIEKMESNNVYDDKKLDYQLIMEETYKEPLKCSYNDELEQLIIQDEKIDDNKHYNNVICDGVDYDKTIHNNIIFKDFNERKFYKTSAACWWCCHTFTNNPCGIPVNYENDTFDVKGLFCSFNCAMARLNSDEKYIHKKMEIVSLMYLMYEKIFNTSIDKIIPSPEKEVLEMFGGNITIDEYRQNSSIFNVNYDKLTYVIPQMEELKITKNNDYTNYVNKNKKQNKFNFFKKDNFTKKN